VAERCLKICAYYAASLQRGIANGAIERPSGCFLS
jgi:hypothetical protein